MSGTNCLTSTLNYGVQLYFRIYTLVITATGLAYLCICVLECFTLKAFPVYIYLTESHCSSDPSLLTTCSHHHRCLDATASLCSQSRHSMRHTREKEKNNIFLVCIICAVMPNSAYLKGFIINTSMVTISDDAFPLHLV